MKTICVLATAAISAIAAATAVAAAAAEYARIGSYSKTNLDFSNFQHFTDFFGNLIHLTLLFIAYALFLRSWDFWSATNYS